MCASKRQQARKQERQLRKNPPEAPNGPPVRTAEAMLIDLIAEMPAQRVVCNTQGRGQFAAAYAVRNPESRVACWFLDVFQQERATRQLEDFPPNLRFLCQPDLPEEEVDLAALVFQKRGEAELVRDLLQMAHQRLRLEGRLVATIDVPDDQWLHNELGRLFPKVTRRPTDDGVIYSATKHEPLKKVKNHDDEFAFRDRGRLIKMKSRPGVFSHRRLDLGARTLINAMEITPGMNIMDLGCGSGAVAIAALCRTPDIRVVAVDSNPRALECVQWAVKANELPAVECVLDADGSQIEEGTMDLVLANPPYFSNYRIAEIFLQTARKALKQGGKLILVTKAPNWFAERMPELFEELEVVEVKEYFLVYGVRYA